VDGDGYSVNDALAACRGPLKYFGYYCSDFSNENPATETWTSYYACCACTGTGIDFETRYFAPGSTLPTNTAEAIATFNSLPRGGPGYGSVYLTDTAGFSNHTSIPGGSKTWIAYHLRATFLVPPLDDVGAFAPAAFRLGPDFGLGGALLIDGQEVVARWPAGGTATMAPAFSPDFYWGGSWSDPNVILSTLDVGEPWAGYYDVGIHTVEAYGFENGYDCGSPDGGPDGPLMRLEYLGVPFDAEWYPLSGTQPWYSLTLLCDG
jgi:hypothetical protein